MKDTTKKSDNPAYTKIKAMIPKMNEKTIVAGLDKSVTARNIEILRRVVLNGENRADVLSDMKVNIGKERVSRLIKKFSDLREFQVHLEDGMSSVKMPTVYAGSFSEAAPYLKRNFCAYLDLPGWKLRCGDHVVSLNSIPSKSKMRL